MLTHRIYTLHVSIQERRERRGKELTELLLRKWNDKKETKVVAGSEKVTARDVNRKRCHDLPPMTRDL